MKSSRSKERSDLDISVIIPTHNRARSLLRCLRSLAEQDCPAARFEVIVCDDGSHDATKAKVAQFAQDHPNVRYLRQSHKGVSAARNLGVREARGDIIAFIDDDCIADKGWLRNISDTYDRHPGLQLVQGRFTSLPTVNPLRKMHLAFNRAADGKRIIKYPDRSGLDQALFFGPMNASIKRAVLLRHGLLFDENLMTREDADLYRRMKLLGLDIRYSPKISVLHQFESGPLAFLRRHFGYGRGEYHLARKWRDKNFPATPPIELTFDKLVAWYGTAWAMLLRAAIYIKDRISMLGLAYEGYISKRKHIK